MQSFFSTTATCTICIEWDYLPIYYVESAGGGWAKCVVVVVAHNKKDPLSFAE